jgi:hypothetical protein
VILGSMMIVVRQAPSSGTACWPQRGGLGIVGLACDPAPRRRSPPVPHWASARRVWPVAARARRVGVPLTAGAGALDAPIRLRSAV